MHYSFLNPYLEDSAQTALVYIEEKIGNRILFDFVDSNEFELFSTIIGLPNNWETEGSMIEFLNYTGRRIQKGVIYRLNLGALRLLDITTFIEQPESLILAYQVNLINMTEQLFGASVAISKITLERFGVRYGFTPPLDNLSRNLKADKVVVRKIGQGNWNELYYKDHVHTVFDAGTIYTTSRTDLIQLIGNRDQIYQKSKPLFILSHWDVDHYHFLLAMEDETIRSFQKFVFRNKIPSLTARKVMGRFSVLNPKAVFPVEAEPRPRNMRGVIRLTNYPLNNSGTMQLVNAQANRSRNKSGIGILFRDAKNSIVFSGDFNYDQLNLDVLPLINYQHDNHHLIVPHHGGKAGRIIYLIPPRVVDKRAVISVGKNPYNPKHPYASTITTLMKLGFIVARTDLRSSDYIITL